MLEDLGRSTGGNHTAIFVGIGGVILLALLSRRSSGISQPGLGPAIQNSYIPNGSVGASDPLTAQELAAVQQNTQFSQLMQSQAEQYQQQLSLIQAQTQSQLAIQGQSYNAQQQLVNSQTAASNSILAHAAQAKNNPCAGAQGWAIAACAPAVIGNYAKVIPTTVLNGLFGWTGIKF